jgi:hypothetical protein
VFFARHFFGAPKFFRDYPVAVVAAGGVLRLAPIQEGPAPRGAVIWRDVRIGSPRFGRSAWFLATALCPLCPLSISSLLGIITLAPVTKHSKDLRRHAVTGGALR